MVAIFPNAQGDPARVFNEDAMRQNEIAAQEARRRNRPDNTFGVGQGPMNISRDAVNWGRNAFSPWEWGGGKRFSGADYARGVNVPNSLANPWGPGAHGDPSANKTFFPAEQLYPLAVRPITDAASYDKEVLEQYNQLIGTSENLRNYNLQQLLQNYNMPLEQAYAAQGVGDIAQSRAGSLDALRAAMAQRGLYNSGVADEGRLGIEEQYLRGVGAAQMQARQQENQRKQLLLRELLNIPQDDIRFYEAIRSGAVPAGNMWNVNIQDWGQVAQGLGTAVRSAASAAAGGGGVGMGGGFGGGGGGWMSFIGRGGA